MAFDVALVASLFAVGTILFGHFEERTPKWRRLLKFAIIVAVVAVLDRVAGAAWARGFLAAAASVGVTTHFVVLRRHGVDPWTAEPRDKYYALRGWTK